MPGTRISGLTAVSGANSANNDDLVIFDTDADETKRISRSQLADGLAGDLPYTPAGFVNATTIPTAIAEIVTDLSAAGGAALIGNTPAGDIAASTVQAALNELDADKQPLNAALTSISGLTTVADQLIYTTATDTYAVASLTAAGRAVLDDADAAAQRVTLGLEIGVDVQSYDADTAKYDDTTANFTGALQNGGSDVVVKSDIGVDVQAYDVNTAKYDDATANFTGTLQNGGSDVVVDTDIGATVQAYDANTAKTDAPQVFTAQQTMTSGLVLQTATLLDMADANNAINTTSKVLGKIVFDTSNNKLMIASGSTITSAWYSADGATSVTPA